MMNKPKIIYPAQRLEVFLENKDREILPVNPALLHGIKKIGCNGGVETSSGWEYQEIEWECRHGYGWACEECPAYLEMEEKIIKPLTLTRLFSRIEK